MRAVKGRDSLSLLNSRGCSARKDLSEITSFDIVLFLAWLEFSALWQWILEVGAFEQCRESAGKLLHVFQGAAVMENRKYFPLFMQSIGVV